MQYFNYLTESEKRNIFYIQPTKFIKNDSVEILSNGIGAALYMPATKESIFYDIINKKYPSLITAILCLEDAIGDFEIEKAEAQLIEHIERLYHHIKQEATDKDDLPMLFVRVRNCNQFIKICNLLKEKMEILTGFVFPKLTSDNGNDYFQALRKINRVYNLKLYAMPILESKDVMYKETRLDTLIRISKLFNQYKDLIINVRIGATDFSSLYGIRRSYDMTIYDIGVLKDCIIDILNMFSRVENHFIVSGPVWEYITHIDKLQKEVLHDKANGIIGKTIIHPDHIIPVQAMYVVNKEEYNDALSILHNNNGQVGVMKSEYNNKMNEIKPHANWAKKILIQSKIYGVYNENQSYRSLLRI